MVAVKLQILVSSNRIISAQIGIKHEEWDEPYSLLMLAFITLYEFILLLLSLGKMLVCFLIKKLHYNQPPFKVALE